MEQDQVSRRAFLATASGAWLSLTYRLNAEAHADTTWFTEARFGMFIHFGLYSVPGGVWKGQPMGRNGYAEWIRMQEGWPRPGGIPKAEYDELLAQFNPGKFNANDWVREAEDAGMRYIIVTAKHHDGFALWNSKVSDYNVVRATPFRRDILAELTAACRKRGVKIGFYYSHWQDWEDPGGAMPPWPEMAADPFLPQPTAAEFERYWTSKCLPQIQELIENFHPDLLWFDSWGVRRSQLLTPDRLHRLIAMVRRLDPKILINSRIGTSEGVDFMSTADNDFPAQGFSTPWETSGTMNGSWGYSRSDTAWKTTDELLKHLIDNVSKGGNYQLNVGPAGDGSFPPAAIRRLREMGAWLGVNEEAIYGTSPAPNPQPSWGRLTQKRMADGSRRIYALVFRPVAGSRLRITGLSQLPLRAWALETGEPVEVQAEGDAASIRLPSIVPDERVTTVVLLEAAK